MMIASTSTRHRMVLTPLLATMLLVMPMGNTIAQSALETCATIGESKARLACFDAVALARKEASADRPDPAPETKTAAKPAQNALAPTKTLTDKAADKAANKAAPAQRQAELARARAEAEAARREAEAARAELAAAKAKAESLEAEEKKRKRPKRYSAKIEKVRHNQVRRLIVWLDNGEVWGQSDGGYIPLPDEGETVEIKSGLLGSKFMKFAEGGRAVRVKELGDG